MHVGYSICMLQLLVHKRTKKAKMTNLVAQHTGIKSSPHICQSFQELCLLHIVPFLPIPAAQAKMKF